MYNYFNTFLLTLLVHQVLFLHSSSSQIVIEDSETFKKYVETVYPNTEMKDNLTGVTLPDPQFPNIYLNIKENSLHVYELRFNVDQNLCHTTSLNVTLEYHMNEQTTASIKLVYGMHEPVPLPLPTDNSRWPSFSASIALGSINVRKQLAYLLQI